MNSISSAMAMQFDPSQRWKSLSVLWSVVQVFFFGVSILLLLLMVSFNLQILPERGQIEFAFIVIVVPILLILSIVQAQRSYHQSVSRRRQILSGEWQERTQFQPAPQNQNALPSTPIWLGIRLNLAPIILNFILILLCFGGILLLLWSLYSTWATFLNNYGNAATAIALDAWLRYVVLAIILWVAWTALGVFVNLRMRRWLCPELEATEDGLAAWYPGEEVIIPWGDVRYFALVKQHKSSPDPNDWTYEIGDGEKSIRWQQPYMAKRMYPLYVSELPRDQYEQEFANLLSLIAARTGRPLLDMRLK
ncbi:hypothetical protein KSD_76240 [Ktedonobacter sp. SOSP1-85]|uniref:hypothetical protein n=1 Tax=Ktedonobacter sp. SOSP1-85 TaxID=2778367 RepID=UPI0019164AE8|nr:hypothetical protein [Ktedonobacter sp. SOSP1-85]GHO79853.1 hypothetical protein KSD_76240 [Ktedonobacter sp. SOSP1-85]